jgi:hypothetical protein
MLHRKGPFIVTVCVSFPKGQSHGADSRAIGNDVVVLYSYEYEVGSLVRSLHFDNVHTNLLEQLASTPMKSHFYIMFCRPPRSKGIQNIECCSVDAQAWLEKRHHRN